VNARIVGIAGGSASGKTTVARDLARALGAVQIAHDRYYRPLPQAFRGGRMLEYNFDHPDALETERLIEDLQSLRAGRTVTLVDYDFITCDRMPEAAWLTVAPTPVVVVEGILALADPGLRALFDLAVFVDCPADVRLARRILRDIAERGDTPQKVVHQYLATVRPMHEAWVEPSRVHAHLVLDGTAPVDRAVDEVRRKLSV
jgi:uridine kinase